MFRVEQFKIDDQGQAAQLRDDHGELADSEDRDGRSLKNNSFKLPGFGLPLNMMAIMDKITDKADWDKKVFGDTIVQKWRQEALGTEDLDVSENMLDWCVAELRDKARDFQSDGSIPTLDFDAAVVKSDTAISPDLKEALRVAVAPLEDVPMRLRDYHPGSDGKVLDLVHPSLFPLVYGRSRVLSSGRVELADCVNCIGKGEIVTKPDDTEVEVEYSRNTFRGWVEADARTILWSKAFQWLPCDVKLAGDYARITSYINNLHPTLHPELYSVIERFIAKAIPLWDLTLSSTLATRKARIFHDWNDEEYYDCPCPPEELEDDWDAYDDWMKTNRVLRIRPEPRDFESHPRLVDGEVNLRKQFGEQGLQVIVKLANIELTTDKLTYEGGSWHVEGQLNERICATALYYYDSVNVEDSSLAFRHRTDEEGFESRGPQYEHDGVQELYGVQEGGPKMQELGNVVTREGRLLAFPNVFQHRVSPFKLEDPSKPGHRKILALFLIDPHCRIISTANVPPQQKDWWSPEILSSERLAKLPTEIVDHIVEDVEDFPISLKEAKEFRLMLIEERKVYGAEVNEEILASTFNFCEH